jgi:hypothetical protein
MKTMPLTKEQKKWLKKHGINPATITRCPMPCNVCAGSDHHWLYDGKQMRCKHCPAKRPVSKRDLQ